MATSRYGILKDDSGNITGINGVNNWSASDAAMKCPPWYASGSGSLTDAVSRMLSPGYFKDWESFASTKHNDPHCATNYLSLEYIHNVIHVSHFAAHHALIDLRSMLIVCRMLLAVVTCRIQTLRRIRKATKK